MEIEHGRQETLAQGFHYILNFPLYQRISRSNLIIFLKRMKRYVLNLDEFFTEYSC